jgi:hypothetical protein
VKNGRAIPPLLVKHRDKFTFIYVMFTGGWLPSHPFF